MDDPDAIEIELLDVGACEEWLAALPRTTSLRPTRTRLHHILTVVTSVLAHHGAQMSVDQLDVLANIADGCEDRLVRLFRDEDLTEPAHLLALFNALYAEFAGVHADAEHAAMREQYREHGLHGMYRRARAPPEPAAAEPEGPVCAVCMDRAPECNVSDRCAHPTAVCASCAARLEACPICRL